MGDAKWNGRAMKFGSYNVQRDLTIKPKALGALGKPLKLTAAVNNAGNVKIGRPDISNLGRALPATWTATLKGFPPMILGDAKWDGTKLIYKNAPIYKEKALQRYYADVGSSRVFFDYSIDAEGYPVFISKATYIN